MVRVGARAGIVLYVRVKALAVGALQLKRVKYILEKKVYNAFEMSAIPHVFIH